jgi:hypothetical protein
VVYGQIQKADRDKAVQPFARILDFGLGSYDVFCNRLWFWNRIAVLAHTRQVHLDCFAHEFDSFFERSTGGNTTRHLGARQE